MKKYYDENNHLVGISLGDITSNVKDCDFDNMIQVANLLAFKPVEAGKVCHLIENENDYDYEFESLPIVSLSDDELKEVFKEQLLNSLTINSRPSGRDGFHLEPRLSGTTVIWEFVKDENESNVRDGSYLHPLEYNPGMLVFNGKFYTDGEDIWEAIATGVPVDFTDRNYFDIR